MPIRRPYLPLLLWQGEATTFSIWKEKLCKTWNTPSLYHTHTKHRQTMSIMHKLRNAEEVNIQSNHISKLAKNE